jgi:flagellar biosynthesis/type III secretory pathway chaperone
MNGHYLKSIKEVAMIALEVTKEELSLLKMLLNREEVSTRIEIHHARMSFEYRDYLKAREKEIGELLERIKQHLPDEH